MLLATAWRTARGPFLILTPVCVALGSAAASLNPGSIEPGLLILVLLGALTAHVSVNMLNEYEDFTSGLDLETKRTAFSGGSGALPENPRAASLVLAGGLAALLLTCVIGLVLVWLRGWPLMVVGLAGVALIVSYTRWINRHPLLCLLAPGAGFGLLMTGGTAYVLSAQYSLATWLSSMLVFCLANNLLLLNQFPDIAADRGAGRRHIAIALGTGPACAAYALFLSGAAACVLAMVALRLAPAVSAIALSALLAGAFALTGAWRFREQIGRHERYLAANVVATLLTPALLAGCLLGF